MALLLAGLASSPSANSATPAAAAAMAAVAGATGVLLLVRWDEERRALRPVVPAQDIATQTERPAARRAGPRALPGPLMWRVAAGIAAAFLLAANCRRRFMVVTVTGVSMQPTLAPGDRLLVRRTPLRQVQVGQVTVLQRPGLDDEDATMTPCRASSAGLIIKRVAAIPGNPIPAVCLRDSAASTPARVPDSMFIILGDNPDHSYDLRHAGLIAGDLMVGVVVRRIAGSALKSALSAL
jgi:signal peptidase I